MRYSAWAALGFCYGFYEVSIGLRQILWAPEHRVGMRSAGYLTAPYQALSEIGNPVDQCRLLLGKRGADDELPNMLDVERVAVTEPRLRAWCDYYDDHTERELLIYTGAPWWLGHIAQGARARYSHYGLMIAGYPFDAPAGTPQPMDPASVALRSNPPVGRRPAIPPPWLTEWSWQHTGHGRLPGYGNDLDLQVSPFTEADLRARYTAGQQPPPGDAAQVAAIRGHVAAIEGLL